MSRSVLGRHITFAAMVALLAGVGGELRAQAPASAARSADVLMLRELLVGHSFGRLETLFAAYTDSMRADIRTEALLLNGFAAFSVPDSTLRAHLDAWVTTAPSAAAHTARAAYFIAIAWEARGAKYISDTDRKQLAEMERWFLLATGDLAAALALDSTSAAPHWLLLSVAQAIAPPEAGRRVYDIGARLAPASLFLRASYLHSLTPRWGGSHDEMRRFAAESQQFASANPQLRVLQGFVAWDEGYTRWLEGDLEGALEKFTEALSYGEYWHFRVDRAHVLYELDREESALIDFNRALRQRPQLAEALAGRALAYWYLADKDLKQRDEYERRARADLALAARIDPSDQHVRYALRHYPELRPAVASR